jgi:hypothetical protein
MKWEEKFTTKKGYIRWKKNQIIKWKEEFYTGFGISKIGSAR